MSGGPELDHDASLDRASALTGTPATADAVIFKVHEGASCHCFHCWPETWAFVNDFLSGQGPIEDEGDLLLCTGDDSYVLECHESGPEVVAYVGAGASVVSAIAAVIAVIVAARRQEARQQSRPLKLTITHARRGFFDEETSVTLEAPDGPDLERMIASQVESALRRRAK